MIVAHVHSCAGCGVEGRSVPDDGPPGWVVTYVLSRRLELCDRCKQVIQDEKVVEALLGLLRERVEQPVVGDEVELLVDGCRGKFKGCIGVIAYGPDGTHPHAGYSIRVPGKVAPGETQEYCGPYLREQFRVVRRCGATAPPEP